LQANNSKRSKGENVKKQLLTVLFTLISFLGLGIGARAQDAEIVIANVPHDFVAGGRVLPTGTYKISRVVLPGSSELLVRNYDTAAGVYVLPTEFRDAPGKHAQLSLLSVGGKYFLNKIQTSNGIYTIAIPHSTTKLAQTEQHEGIFASGSN
jgi:hypothetical protein